jgi:hypothetical protein
MLYANTTPFYIRDLVINVLKCPWEVLKPIPYKYKGQLYYKLFMKKG